MMPAWEAFALPLGHTRMKALDSIAHRDTLSAENIAEFTFASNEAASASLRDVAHEKLLALRENGKRLKFVRKKTKLLKNITAYTADESIMMRDSP